MEPIKGGNLNNVSNHEDIRRIFKEADPTQTDSSWALRYVVSLEGVMIVLSGMSALEQMQQNYRTLVTDFKPVTGEEEKMLARFDYYDCAVYNDRKSAKDCLRCGTCMGECPQNLPIPDLLQEAMDVLYAGDDYDLWANHGEHV